MKGFSLRCSLFEQLYFRCNQKGFDLLIAGVLGIIAVDICSLSFFNG